MTRSRYSTRFGANILPDGRTRFTLWAPDCDNVALEIEGKPPLQMNREAQGCFETVVECPAGSRYRFRVKDDLVVPDPASRFQPDGPHGPSEVIDGATYRWTQNDWKGRPWEETVIYEVHLGTEGGYAAFAKRLPELVDLGITAIEILPVNTFGGTRNWGYDGVLPYAPSQIYGTPGELKSLIDQAHGLGLMVILDVVYNHFGPDGNYLPDYASGFFNPEHKTVWGAGIAFTQPQVADYFVDNALYWIEEYRFDGLRIDAAWAITDRAWFYRLLHRLKTTKAPDRHVHLILENENNDSILLRDGYDGQWNQDWHALMHVMLTDETYDSFACYASGTEDKMKRVLAEGQAWQGEFYPPGSKKRGFPSADLPPTRFISHLQNHDQIGNRPEGDRLTTHTDPHALHAAYAFLLLCPMIPMIFMGEEWGCTTPFLFFCDFPEKLGEAVRKGREKEFRKRPEYESPEKLASLPAPNDPATFEMSRPDRSQRKTKEGKLWLERTRTLLRIRRERIVPGLGRCMNRGGEILGHRAFRAEWSLDTGEILRLYLNLGRESLTISESAEPLYQTPSDRNASVLPPASMLAVLVPG